MNVYLIKPLFLSVLCVAGLFFADTTVEAADFDPFGQDTNDTAVFTNDFAGQGPVIPEIQFANNDISMAFQIISDATGWSIFPTEQVGRAKISLWSKNITAKELLDKVVTLAGFIYHRRGNIISVMTYDEYMQYHGLTRQVITLRYADATSVAAAVKPFLTRLGRCVVHKETNTIVLYEADANLESIIGITEKLDTPADDIIIDVVNLKYVSCEVLAAILQQAFAGQDKTVKNKSSGAVKSTGEHGTTNISPEKAESGTDMLLPCKRVGIYAVSNNNQLVIVGTKSDVEKVKNVVAKIDVYGDNMMLEVIDLRFADCEMVAKTLQQVFGMAQAQQGAKGAHERITRSARPITHAADEAEGELAVPQAEVGVYSTGRTNQLIIKAFKADLEKIKKLVAKLDVFIEPTTKSYSFTYVDAAEIYKGLERILDTYSRYGQAYSGAGRTGQGGYRKESGITLVERTNSILLTGPPSAHRIMTSIKDSIDAPGTYEAGLIKVYKIQNADVQEIATTIRELIERRTEQEGKPGEPQFEEASQGPPEPGQPEMAETEQFVPRIETKVSVNKATNSVVVLATARQHRELEKLIKELDVRRKQVLIKATIVEITSNDDTDFGVELDHIRGDGVTFTSFGLSVVDPVTGQRDIIVSPGATAAVLRPNRIQAIFKALQSSGNARIESAPQILVNDNAVGSIQSIVEEPTTQTNFGEITTSTSFAGFVEAGTQFAITPHISEGGYLRVEYQIILNSFGTKSTDPSIPPPRSTSSIQSEATVPDGATIVVGGLQAVHESKSIDKVPLLGDIPLIGMVFRNTIIRKQYITTYLFITPTIMKNEDFSDLKDATREALDQVSTDDDRTLSPKTISLK